MTTLREAAQQALEALTNCTSEYGHRCNRCDSEVDEGGLVVAALRAALAQEEHEPVAWIHRKHHLLGHAENMVGDADKALTQGWEPLYTAPPRCPNCASLEAQNTELDRKLGEIEHRTLTDEVIADLWHQNGGFHHHFARAVERWLKGQP